MSRSPGPGLLLAAAIFLTWAALHVWGVFFHPLSGMGLAVAPFVVLLICWLDVGLFIVAHDAMHGSLAPGRPGLNRAAGRLALFAYAGFSYDRLLPKHHAHHRHAGTADDPDFHAPAPRRFLPWYAAFFRQYFGVRELIVLTALVAFYRFVLQAEMSNLLVFWALPAILSSLQLFLFGTWLPHREADGAFDDHHRARSSEWGWLPSLLTCFHFGYHLEHHRAPHVPWWALPAERRRRLAAAPPR